MINIFVAGSKTVSSLDEPVLEKLRSICQKGYTVLVGDCFGTDASVQEFLCKQKYENVIVYASNGKARNNIGNWQIRNIRVPSYIKGADFYKQKDKAMADDADYGLMIWDGESKGTLYNIENMLLQDKIVAVCLVKQKTIITVENYNDFERIRM